MRAATSALLLGAASAAVFQQEQQVLGGVRDAFRPVVGTAEQTLESLEAVFGKMPTEAKGLWEEMKLLVPGFMEKAQHLISLPKPHKRKPDSQWDYVVKGADLQKVWVETDGVQHRKLEGDLESYNLRAKKVDPSKLNVDKVKQYSGYLDDEANDKHLFYCMFLYAITRLFGLLTWPQGSSSPGMIPRTIP
jgi:cathepsin A (carboxypeptidase C)